MNCPINCPPRALRVPSCGQYRVLLEINTSPPWEHTHSSSVFPPLSNNLYRIYLLPLLWKFTRGKTLRVTFRSIRRFKCSRLSRVAGSQHAKLLSRIYALLNFRWFFLTVSRIVSGYFTRGSVYFYFLFLCLN